MYPIITKYLGPTDNRGSRIKAYCERGSTIVNYDDALNSDANHANACAKLCEKFLKQDLSEGWPRSLRRDESPWSYYRPAGTLPRHLGQVHVCYFNDIQS